MPVDPQELYARGLISDTALAKMLGGNADQANQSAPDPLFSRAWRPANDPTSADARSRAVVRAAVPGIYDYLTQPRPAPQITPNAAGKVPPADYDPYLGPALQDAANIGMTAIGGPEMGPAMRGASIAARAARAVPAESRLGGMMSDMFNIGGTAAGVGAAAPGEAAADTRPTINGDEAQQLMQLNHEITALSQQRAKATKDLGPKGAAVQAQAYDAQIAQRSKQVDAINAQVRARQDAYDQRQEDYAKAGQPFQVREGDLTNRIRAGALGASAMTGALRGAKGMGAAGSILGGAVEGAAGVLFPSAVDITKPEDTDAYKTTQRNLFDNPDYWKRVVAPDAAYGAILAAAGHGIGHAAGAPFAKRPPPTPTPPPSIAAPSSQGGRAWPSDSRQIDMAKDQNGIWRERGTGQYVPKRLWPPENTNVIPMKK